MIDVRFTKLSGLRSESSSVFIISFAFLQFSVTHLEWNTVCIMNVHEFKELQANAKF